MKNKKSYFISLILLVGVFSLIFFYKKDNSFNDKIEENTINEIENGIAVYVANDTDYERVDSIPEEGYTYNESLSYCNESEVKNENIKISYDMDTKKISITPVANEKTKCYLYFDVQKSAEEEILANVTVNSGTPDFSQVATTDEGVYAVADGMYGGYSYYWRGAVTNNYVTFGGFCWRIIRINGDGSIRLIYDGTTCHANGTTTTENIAVIGQVYNSIIDSSEYVGWSYTFGEQHGTGIKSDARSQVEAWYTNNLTSYASYIDDGKYCNDREVASGGIWETAPSSTLYYAAYIRLVSAKTPTLSCTNASDVFTVKIGLITADEVSFAGGVYNRINTSYYLYNGNYYWTMSPYYWYSANGWAYVFSVISSGYFGADYVGNTYGLRPVINLNANVTFSSGNGTQSTPYVVKTT